MRRASTCLALLGSLAVLGLPAAASAAPTVTFKSKAVPIPAGRREFPHTGNILAKHGGLGAALEANFVISGSGYGATPQNPARHRRWRPSTSSCLPARRSTRPASLPAPKRR